MWHSMFHLDLPVLEKILRAVIVYAFLVVALRLAGKREMAQLSSADFIVLLAVANAVQNGIIGNDNSVTGGIIGATALFAVNGALVALLFRSGLSRQIVEGSPTVLARDGQVDRHALRRTQITAHDLLVAVQRTGTPTLEETEAVVLEPNGTIVATPRVPSDSDARLDELTRQVALLTEEIRRLATR